MLSLKPAALSLPAACWAASQQVQLYKHTEISYLLPRANLLSTVPPCLPSHTGTRWSPFPRPAPAGGTTPRRRSAAGKSSAPRPRGTPPPPRSAGTALPQTQSPSQCPGAWASETPARMSQAVQFGSVRLGSRHRLPWQGMHACGGSCGILRSFQLGHAAQLLMLPPALLACTQLIAGPVGITSFSMGHTFNLPKPLEWWISSSGVRTASSGSPMEWAATPAVKAVLSEVRQAAVLPPQQGGCATHLTKAHNVDVPGQNHVVEHLPLHSLVDLHRQRPGTFSRY
jgi:hypothetical protein